METTLEQPVKKTVTPEKLLIYTNETETLRIRNEVQSRADLANQILSLGISNEKFREVAVSVDAVEKYIHARQLSENPELSKLHKAGIVVEAKLPPALESLKYALLAWVNLSGGSRHQIVDKCRHLVLRDGKYVINENDLEIHFVQSGYKVYVSGEMLAEYREVQNLIAFLEKYRMPSGQVAATPFLHDRVIPNGRETFIPRWQYFVEGNRTRRYSV